MFAEKKVLVAGGTGTIGIPLVRKLLEQEAQVTVVSLESEQYAYEVLGPDIVYSKLDLTSMENCLQAVLGQEYVFNLVGKKGSVGIGESKVASYFYPMLLYQTHLMEAAFLNKIKRYLYVSSTCGYPCKSVPKKEECWWEGEPTQNDRIPGLVKRIGEVQAEAYLKEHHWDAVRIVRPTVVYGPYDNFDSATGHVIPSLISRIVNGENPLIVWGDGTAIRDFIYSEEVAEWLLVAMEKAPPCVPINLGSGVGTSIKDLVEIILRNVEDPPLVNWDKTKPVGDPVRILSTERAKKYLGFELKVGLEEGISKTVKWYRERITNYV